MMEALTGFEFSAIGLLLVVKVLVAWLGVGLALGLLWGRIIRHGQRPARPRTGQMHGRSTWFPPEDRSAGRMRFERRFERRGR